MRRGPSPSVVLAALAGSFVLAALVAWLPDRDLPDAGPPPATSRSPVEAATPPAAPGAYACVEVRGEGQERGGYCQRLGADFVRRGPVTAGQRAAATAAIDEIRTATRAGWCPSPNDRACARPFAATDVDAVRAALAAAGHPDGQVRLAEADDPAPVGALMVGVPVGGACVVQFTAAHPSGGGSEFVVGPLRPHGRCLDP